MPLLYKGKLLPREWHEVVFNFMLPDEPWVGILKVIRAKNWREELEEIGVVNTALFSASHKVATIMPLKEDSLYMLFWNEEWYYCFIRARLMPGDLDIKILEAYDKADWPDW